MGSEPSDFNSLAFRSSCSSPFNSVKIPFNLSYQERVHAGVRKIKLREGTDTAILFGHHDRHLKIIEEEFGVRLLARVSLRSWQLWPIKGFT